MIVAANLGVQQADALGIAKTVPINRAAILFDPGIVCCLRRGVAVAGLDVRIMRLAIPGLAFPNGAVWPLNIGLTFAGGLRARRFRRRSHKDRSRR